MSHFTPLKGIFAIILSLLFLAAEAQTPANQPAAFTAVTLSGTSVKLSWPLSTGGQLPTHYVVLARVVPGGTFVNPIDGSGPTEDTDLADNLGAHIEAHGTLPIEYDWTGLPADTDFEFKLIPYNNASAGTNPRFLVAGARTATASTKKPSIILSATPVTAIDETVGTIHAEVTSNHGSALTERGVKWGYSSGALTNTSADPATTIGTFTRALTGLNRGDEIFYAAYATSAAGTTTTAVQSFFTYAQLPDNQIAFVTATATSSSTIHLDFPSINDNNAGAADYTAGYVILRRTGNAPNDTDHIRDGVAPNALPDPMNDVDYVATITNVTQDDYDDTGLNPSTNYFYSVVPYNIAGAEFKTINYKVGSGLTVGNNLTFSNESDIVLGSPDGTQATIGYKSRQALSVGTPLAIGNTMSLGNFTIRDGGGTDPDSKTTVVKSISINLANYENVHSIGLFNGGGTLLHQLDNISTGTLTFTLATPLTVADNDVATVSFRATFRNVVDDNESIGVTITGATTDPGSSEFADADAGGAATPANVNKIEVNANRLRLSVVGATPAQVGTVFSLLVQAIDGIAFPNIDKDFDRPVDLYATIPPSDVKSLSLQPQLPLANVALSQGEFTWTGLSFTTAGNYLITVSDDAYDDNKNDGTVSVPIVSQSATITTITESMCYGVDSHELDDIVIAEADNAGFTTGTNLTFSLTLPTGFVFDQTKTSGFSKTGADVTIPAPGHYTYPQPNVVQVTFSVTGTSNLNSLRFADLFVSAAHPGGSDPAPITGTITRLGGTAVISGDVPGTVHGTLDADNAASPGTLGFTVAKINVGDPTIAAAETRFSKNGSAVRLSGTPGPSPGKQSSFFGSGVTLVGSEYRFNPASLATGTYTVSYKVTVGTCDFVYTKQFEVYETLITNLSSSYCDNQPASDPLTVSQAVIDSRFGAGWVLSRFVHWNGSAWTDIVTPANNIFDPKVQAYKSIYQTYGGFYIGWIVHLASNPAIESGIQTQFVTVRTAPQPVITLATTEFCADDLPVTLTGTPANSDDAGVDNFDAGAQNGAISSNGTPRIWTLNPSQVTGVTTNPVTFNLTYKYRSPSTGCSATSAPVSIKIKPRPQSVVEASVTNREQAVCQGGAVTPITVPSLGTTTYNWYKDAALTELAGPPAATFTPTTNTLTPGVTTYYVTRTILECESNREPVSPSAATQVKLTINATPPQPVPDFTREYCAEQTIIANDFQITAGNDIHWYKTPPPGTRALEDEATPTLSEIQTDLGVSTAAATTYTFYVTQTANNCEGTIDPTVVTVIVKPRPVLTIAPDDGTNAICKTDPILMFSAFDQGSPATSTTGNGVWTGISAIVGNPVDGTAQVNPSLLSPGEYVATFSFTNNTTLCSNTKTVNLLVRPTIKPKLMPLDSCELLFVRINNQSTIDMGSLTSTPPTIEATQWNFGDGTGLPLNDGPVDDGRTRNTYFSPEHLFGGTGSFLLQYTMRTSDHCTVSASRQLQVNPKPKVSFTWSQACMNTISETKFIAATNPVLPITTYNWDFHRDGQLTYTSAGSGASPTVTYDAIGRDSVRLIVTTNAQCKDTIQHPVFIVPAYPPIKAESSYTQDFDNGTDGWIDGGKASSWALGKPNETNIQTVGANNHAWDTNLHGSSNPGEQSYVLSPCFDFTEAVKPILSMDIWSDTPLQNDGAVLQYNTNGRLLDDASWTVLGEKDGGANWYDEPGISSSPGNQPDTDIGWTGAYGGWRHAAYKLDNLKGLTNVVFRIAFASNVPRRDGFAFDNVFIGERTRTVLLESFTNSSAAANTKIHNDLFRAFSNNSQEIAKVEYHTAFPGHDPINAMNTAINGSRAAFYGLSSTGTFTLDGQVAANVANLTKIYDDRVLTPSPFRIDIQQVKDGSAVRISTTLTNITNQTIAVSKANVFTVLVEKSITDPGMLGSNGDPEFVYVARKMLPNAAGSPIGQDIGPLGTFSVPEVTWDELSLLSSGNGAIVVFVQSTEGDNKNVFQAAIVDATAEPDITTGNELPEWAGNIRVFPNPANGSDITIALPEKAKQTLPVTLTDAQGRNMLATSIPKGNAQHTVTTSTLNNGLYIVEIETDKGRFVRKKIMVMH